jgi:hypothetical protein
MKHLSATLLVAGLLASPLWGQIVPAGVTGTGPSNNSANLIVDGVTPPQNTEWQADTNVWWTDFGTSFTIDLGARFLLTDIAWSVDNNDAYALAWSTDGTTFANLFTIGSNDGEVPYSPGGMDTMNSFGGDLDYVAAMDFGPVAARYLRIDAVPGGDGLNAVGEVTAYGRALPVAVPEPSTYGLLGALALAALVFWRRQHSA